MDNDKINGKQVLEEEIHCEVCKDPEYLGKTDTLTEVEYCGNCDRILSYPHGDYVEEDYYGDDSGDY